MKCDHKSCGIAEKVWLPYTFRGGECGLKPHPYCTECGAVKNLSSEKSRDIGYYMNVISQIGKKIKISQAQIRLIAQEMERLEFDDKYTIDRYTQDKVFIEILRRYVPISDQAIRSHL